MSQQARGTIKGYFVTGATPTEQNFVDFLDSVVLLGSGITDNDQVNLTTINEQSSSGITINSILTVHNDVVGINKASPTANRLHIDNGSSSASAVQIDVSSGESMDAMTISGSVTGNLNAINLINTGSGSSDNARIRLESTNGDAYYSCYGGGSVRMSLGYRASANAFMMSETWPNSPFFYFSRADNVLGLFTTSPDANCSVTFGGSQPIKVPNITTTQRDAVTPSAGMICYNITTGTFQGYDGAWKNFTLTV